MAALEHLADVAGELDVLEATGDLPHRVAVDLAVLGGDLRRGSLAFCFTRFRRLNIASVRLATLEERHSWNAAFATATAASSPSTEARATAPVC